MVRMLIQRIKFEIKVRIEDILWLLGKKEEVDPSTLTKAEQWVQGELMFQRKKRLCMIHNGFGFHYSEYYLRTHSAEEVYARYLQDVADLYQFVEECTRRKKAMANEE